MRIKLHSHYRNVNGVNLAIGEHEVDEQLGHYLAANGYGEIIVEVIEKAEAPTAPKVSSKK